MNYNHTIVEIAPQQFVLTRQNIHSDIWSCGDVRSRNCCDAALVAAQTRLTTIYPAIECATRALFDLYTEEEVAGNISFLSAADAKSQKNDSPAAVYVVSREQQRREYATPRLEL